MSGVDHSLLYIPDDFALDCWHVHSGYVFMKIFSNFGIKFGLKEEKEFHVSPV
jgi:hypothetical protein